MTYYEAGKGPLIFFIHGAGIRALTYKNSIRELSKNFRVVAPDVMGFGKSDMPPESWKFTDYGKYLSIFLQQLFPGNINVIGHSLGGRIAIEVAIAHQKIDKLILIDSTPLGKYFTTRKTIY